MQWGDYYQKVPVAVSAGQGPDVGAIHGTDPATFSAQGLIIAVDDMIQALGYTADDFAPTVFNAVSYKDKKWAIPFSVTPLGLYYNKKVLSDAGLDPEKPPQNKDDYMKALDTLKSKGIQGSWVDPFEFTGSYQFQSLLWQFGGNLYNEDVSKATFNSDAGVQALTWMVDLIKNGYSPANVGQDADITALQNGKTAFNWNGVWQTSGLATIPNLQWGAAPVPQIGTQKGVWSSSTHLAIFNKKGQDPNKIAAAKVFIDFMVKSSLQWAATGELPASTSVRQSAEFQKLTVLKPFADSLAFAHFETPAPGIGDVQAIVNTAVNEGVLQKKSPKQALDDGVAKANQTLQQNKQQYQG
jgi:multiple sugar transport system substrate-binding protein